jgi:hypothetical protein
MVVGEERVEVVGEQRVDVVIEERVETLEARLRRLELRVARLDETGTVAAREIVDELVPAMASLYGTTDGPNFRAQLADMIDTFTDRRVERYWQLLAIMNGWPQRGSSATPAWEWLLAALHAA